MHETNEENLGNIPKGMKTIEIAGYTILGIPMESITLTPDEKIKYEEAGGFIVDRSKVSIEDAIKISADNPDAMIEWILSFETLESETDGVIYKGFDLWKNVYAAFPEYRSLSKEQAIERGLYPLIHYRNFAAREWLAHMYGGHLAMLNKNYRGELLDMYDATYKIVPGIYNIERLAAMGQAPFGRCSMSDGEVSYLGYCTLLGSGSIDDDGHIRGFSFYYIDTNAGSIWNSGRSATSGIIILNK